MKTYPVLYKRNTNGSLNQWQIVVDGNCFYTIEGLKDGVLTTSKPTCCEGKNIGKANETSPEQQAISEAESKMQKKLDKGYTQKIDDVDTCKEFFSPMLAHKYNDYKDGIQFPVLASRKIDGLRYVARKDGGWTRNGKKYVSVPHIDKILKPLFDAHPDWIVDSEIYNQDIPFEKIVSLVKKTKPVAQDLVESEKVCNLYIFDGVTDDVTADFETRFAEIRKEIGRLIGNDSHLKFVENEKVNNHDELMKLHDQYVSEGWEGLMVRRIGSAYENKRSKNLLKYKSFFDEEFNIVDVIEGIGQRSGMAGKIVVTLKSGETCEAGIRGGEAYYKQLLKDRVNLIGKKATVRYQGFTEKGSLRFPVAIAIDPIDR